MPEKSRKVYESLTDWARDVGQIVIVPIARVLKGFGIHPNTITVLGFLLSLGVGAVLVTGHFSLGGWLLALVAPLDAIDGTLARLNGQRSRFGAFLDSTLDRLSDASFIAGLAIHYLQQEASRKVMLSLLTLVGVILVSYTRARAESNGFSCKVGILTRLERTAVLAVGLILGIPVVTLWVLTIGSALTVLQRIFHVYRTSYRDEAKE
jgi:CDP-diacylglycerol--glycerol-3-phosphate 3-phosphatidyltransferase